MFSLFKEHDREEDGDAGVVIEKFRLYVAGIPGGTRELTCYCWTQGTFLSYSNNPVCVPLLCTE